MGLFESARRPATDPADGALTLSLPHPPPQEKNQQPTQKCLPIKLPHHQCAAPGTDPIDKTPSVNPVYRTHVKDSHPKPASDHVLTSSRTHISSHCGEQRRDRSNNLPRRITTATCVRAMGQDYPFTGPSPGANPPIYPSSLPRALGKLSGNILPKDIKFFFFF